MKVHRHLTLLFALGMTFSQVACNSSDDFDKDLVQVQAYLGLAEVYKNQGQFRASIIETQNASELMPENIDTKAFIADLFLDIGDVNSAIEQLDAALLQQPDNVQLELLLAEAYLASNRIAEGQAIVESMTVTGDELIQRNWLLGNFQAASGNSQAAQSTFDDIIATDNGHVPTLISLSKLAYLNGDTAAATDYLRQATDSSGPNDVDVWIWRGQLAMLQEDYPAAEEAFFEALDIMALYDIMTAKRFTTMQSILVPLRMQGKNDEALRYSEIIAATPQGEFNTDYANAISLFEQGSLGEAERALNDLLVNAPTHPGSNILLGIARYSAGDFQEAERLLSEYVDTDTASPQLVTTLAATHLRTNNPERALSVLEDSLQTNPGDTSIMAMIGTIQRGLGDVDASIATLTEALSLAPDAAELHLALAGSYAQLEDLDAAIAELNEAIALNPELAQAKSALLDIHVRAGDTATAQDIVQGWLSEAPDSIYNNMAGALLAMNTQQFDSAKSYLNDALALQPDNVQAQLYLARIDILEERLDDAEDKFEAVLEQQATNADAISGLLALGDLRGSTEDSIARVREIIAANPTEFIPPLVLSQYYLVNNNLDGSLELAETAYGAVQNTYTTSMLADVTNRLAVQAMQQQDFDRARGLLGRLLEAQPENIQTLSLMASVEAQAQNFTAARRHIDAIRNLQPDAAYSYELEGDLHRAQNDQASALTDYRAAWEREKVAGLGLKVYQTHVALGQDTEALDFLDSWMMEDVESAAPKLLLAMNLQMQNEGSQAIPWYEQVYETDPNNLIVLNNLAWLYQDENPERAMELASKAADLYPENADVLDTYGWILLKQDDREQAIAVLEHAAELAPDNTSIQEHLAEARQ